METFANNELDSLCVYSRIQYMEYASPTANTLGCYDFQMELGVGVWGLNLGRHQEATLYISFAS